MPGSTKHIIQIVPASVLLLLFGSGSQAQPTAEAYLSIEGSFGSSFRLLTVDVESTTSLTNTLPFGAETFSSQGGINRAGDMPGTPNTIDSFLELNDTSATNDNGRPGAGLDALLTWEGVADEGGDLGASLPAEDYTFRLSDDPGSGSAYAVDVFGPADQIVFGRVIDFTSGIDSIKVGTNIVFDPNPAQVAVYRPGFTRAGGEVVIANTGNARVEILGNNNQNFIVNGLFTVKQGGVVSIDNGRLTANGGILLDGGTLERISIGPGDLIIGGFNNPQKLTAINGSQVNITGGYELDRSENWIISSGSSVTATLDIDVGDGSLTVSGTGTVFNTHGQADFGFSGGSASVTITDSAAFNHNGAVNIGSNGTVASEHGILRVTDSGVLTTGPGPFTIHSSGTLLIDGGEFLPTGPVNFNGGTFHKIITGSNDSHITAGAGLTILPGSVLKIELAPGYAPAFSDTITLFNTASNALDPFAHFDAPVLDNGLVFKQVIQPSGLGNTLRIIATLPADLDTDGDVDDADFALFFAAFSGPGVPTGNASADLDGDNDTDDADFGLAFAAFTAPGGVANVPEPGSFVMLALTGVALGRRRQAER